MFDIAEELKKLPQSSGVYIMKDETDEIIYVGKAINLKNRVRQYFQPSSQDTPKGRSLAKHIREFEYIVTDNELEALILECSLIKANRPRYNILLKDDKSYPYIKLTLNEHFPRLFMTRNHLKDKAKYYGPYTSSLAIKDTLEVIKKIFQLRTCYRVFPRDIGKGRPCLNYHIGQCKAPCAEHISEEDYGKIISEVMEFLSGNQYAILKKLEKQMLIHSENMEFEAAAELRDKIAAIKTLEEKQKIETDSNHDQDIIAFARANDEALVQVFFVRGGKMTGREHFMLNHVDKLSREEVMTEFIKQFYGETTFIPKELITETEVNEKELIQKWLTGIKGTNVTIAMPQKGEKLKLVQMAAKNAIITLESFGEQIKREKQKTEGALQEIQQALELETNLERIEAYDISNIQGFESVGSMVVFESGKPKRSDYRKFKIKAVFGPNDYASMEEVIHRRFMRFLKETQEMQTVNPENSTAKFNKLPDILFIDGGKGHVHSAQKVLDQLQIKIPVCGMVKDDRHRTRGLFYNEKEISLKASSEGFKLLTRIQDEVHRFAIEYHRKLREKNQLNSILDEVPGIGATRRKALMKHFGGIELIKKAEIEELSAVETMNRKSAAAVYEFFHNSY